MKSRFTNNFAFTIKAVFLLIDNNFCKSKSYLNYSDFHLHKCLLTQKLAKDNALFDANKKACALQAIINELNHPELADLTGDSFYNSVSEIILVRNKFGHCKVIVNEKGIRVLQSAPPIEEFTDENCIDIRRKLITHLEMIHKVKSLLPQK